MAPIADEQEKKIKNLRGDGHRLPVAQEEPLRFVDPEMAKLV
jgi:hypothetical protein